MTRFHRRRLEFLERTGEPLLLLAARPAPRTGDTEYEYRQDSDLYYLTGFPEPEAAALLLPGSTPSLHLFVRPRDPAKEVWEGARVGLDGATTDYGADHAHPIEELDAVLLRELRGHAGIQFALGRGLDQDRFVTDLLGKFRRMERNGGTFPVSVTDARATLHEMRLRKDSAEIDCMRQAARVTGKAHQRAMSRTRPGRHEYEIAAEVEYEFRRAGMCPGYPTIVGSGPNATILHHTTNRRRIEPGDLVLVDAGAETSCLTVDVTRTWPASGRFTPPQRNIYDLVLEAELAAIAAVQPGASFDAPHQAAIEVLVRGLLRLGLLKGSPEENIEGGGYRRYYMHRTSHWLGMDVHDPGAYKIGAVWRPLEAGMVLTVEPGLYLGIDDMDLPDRYRGIGVRIEDDVLVLADGAEVLTGPIPKSRNEVEAIVGSMTEVS